jgi:hypothetical protein
MDAAKRSSSQKNRRATQIFLTIADRRAGLWTDLHWFGPCNCHGRRSNTDFTW